MSSHTPAQGSMPGRVGYTICPHVLYHLTNLEEEEKVSCSNFFSSLSSVTLTHFRGLHSILLGGEDEQLEEEKDLVINEIERISRLPNAIY